jgi:hypothetical protein
MEMDWTQALAIIGSNLALILIMFGTTIAIWLHTDKKIEAIQDEMKRFHGKLERQDAEFKAHLMNQHGHKK